MRSCCPARSSSAASTGVVSTDRIPSAPSTPSTSSNESASASCTRAGSSPVTCTVGGTLRAQTDVQLLQPRLGSCTGDDEHPHVVLATSERIVAGKEREAQLAPRAVRVRDRGDPAVQREREPLPH